MAVGAALVVGVVSVLLQRRQRRRRESGGSTVTLEPAWGADDEVHVPQSFVNPMYAGAERTSHGDVQAGAPDFQRTDASSGVVYSIPLVTEA